MLFAALAVASLMVVLTVAIHMVGLTILIGVMRARSRQPAQTQHALRQMGLILAVVLSLFALHSVQIWLYALLYLLLGEFSSFEAALYFSTSSFTTVGYGDVFLTDHWRLVGAIESANGFLLIGWSTVFLISVISRLRSVEFDWLERREEQRDLFQAAEVRKPGPEADGR